jgi:prepilin-type N-terminal cleavage/methylation domain-containing protein
MKTTHKKHTAFTMIEMLLSLAILGVLLTAIAVAFNASAINYRQNSGIAEAMNSARQALARMTTLIRTGQPSSAIEAQGTCSLMTAPMPSDNVSHDVSFVLNSGQNKLYYNDTTASTSNVLCENVTELTFAKTFTGADVKSVIITMTVTIGDVSETFTAAAVVRKNL